MLMFAIILPIISISISVTNEFRIMYVPMCLYNNLNVFIMIYYEIMLFIV